MTEDEYELFLTLKFNNMDDVIDHFRSAVGIPEWAVTTGTNPKIVATAIRYWVEAGAPSEYEIPPEQAEHFLKLRFNSVDAAYDYLMDLPPGIEPGLSDNELAVLMDYVKPPAA